MKPKYNYLTKQRQHKNKTIYSYFRNQRYTS